LKLRILDNSIRLRLSRSEVDAAATDGLVKGRVRFPGGKTFDYILENSPATVAPEAHLSDNVLTVRVPVIDIQSWAASDKVAIDAEQLLGDGEHLRILIEKDFQCLSPREGEDESDMFPHPGAGTASC